MRADGRFEGRDAELHAVSAVTTDRPVLVRGPAGIGKTRLAREAARRDASAVWLAGSEQLSTIRYAALAPLLSALAITALGDESDLLARIDAALAARAQPPMLVVDDVGRADDGTLAALSLIASARRCRLVLTSRDTDPLPDVVSRLYVDGTLEVVELGPLDPAAVERLLVEEFGAPVDPVTVRAFVERSGGNPLLIRELARGAAAAPPTVGPGGVVAVPVPSARLGELMGARFAGLDDDARRCAELLALTGPIDVTGHERPEVLDRLERDGLLAGDGPVRQLAHPLHAEVLIAEMPPSRRLARQREAGRRLAGQPSAEAQLRAAVLLLEGGERLPLEQVLAAAGHAVTRGDHALVVRITDGVDRGVAPDARLLRLRGHALSLVGRNDDAEACLSLAIEVATDDEQRARACRSLAEHLAVRARDAATAVARLDETLTNTSDPAWRDFLMADRARWAMLVGAPAEYRGDDSTATTADDVARLNVTMTEALVAVMSGRLADADRHVGTGLPLAERLAAEVPNGADLLRLTTWVGRLFAGRFADARAHAEAARLATGVGGEAAGMWSYALAVLDLHGGRPAEAAARSAEAVRLLTWRDFTGLVTTAKAVHATALAQLGRIADARTAIEDLGNPEALDVWAALQHAQAVAWLAAAERRRVDVERLVAMARHGVAAGQLGLSAFASHTAVRLGAPEAVLDDLHDAALRSEGALVPAFAAHAAALAARRPHDLLDTAERLAGLGAFGAAADAARQAAQLFASSARPDAARRATAAAAGWAHPAVTSHELTPREVEIANLAADRWSGREIAEKFGVSVRTVDNHLGRAYRKLGIAGRPELADALRRAGART